MSGEIIRLKKSRLQLPPLVNSTAASGAPPDGHTPMFETNLQETLGIRKFIEMSIADLRTQVEQAAKSPMQKKDFATMKASAYIITAWLTSALMTVDGMLQSAATVADKPLSEMRDQDDTSAA